VGRYDGVCRGRFAWFRTGLTCGLCSPSGAYGGGHCGRYGR